MCEMKIVSRLMSTPTEVFALLVTCGVDIKLSRRGVDLNVWYTDVRDDLARGFNDGMDGLLQERLSHGEGGLGGNDYNLPSARSRGW